MICRPLREDTRHAAAAVVDMRDAYRSFQAEVVGQDTLKLGLREREGLYHRHRQQGELRALAQTLDHLQALPVVGAVVCRQEGPAPGPRKESVTSPRPSRGR